MRVLIVAVAASIQIALSAGAAAEQRVLFIGNSLTAANNLPAMVQGIARERGEAIACEMVAFPNYSLEDHWQRGDAARAIGRGGWTTVVLQQGPSALPESRVLLRAYVKKFDEIIRRGGARTAIYMVWPSRARQFDFAGVHDSYAAAAQDVGALLLPAGDAWRGAWRRDPRLALYADDGFHPTPLGSYLSALVMYQQLTGKPLDADAAAANPSRELPSIALTREQATIVRAAAAEANIAVRHGAR